MQSDDGQKQHESAAEDGCMCKLFARVVLVVGIAKYSYLASEITVGENTVGVEAEHGLFLSRHWLLVMSLHCEVLLRFEVVKHEVNIFLVSARDEGLQEGHDDREQQHLPVEGDDPVEQGKDGAIEEHLEAQDGDGGLAGYLHGLGLTPNHIS